MIIPVRLENGSYDVTVERGALQRVGSLFQLDRKVLIVTDEGVPPRYAETVASAAKEPVIVTVPQGEGSKSFATLKHLLSELLAHGFSRKDCVGWNASVGRLSAEVSRYADGNNLYAIPEDADWKSYLNPESLKVAKCRIEPGLAELPPGTHVQFERIGYFFSDPKDHSKEHPVFNRTVALKDSWSKIVKKA